MSFFSQFTPDQLRTGYGKNAASLRQMLAKAERTGRKVNGYTADYLRERVALYTWLSTATDDQIRAHIKESLQRLAEGRF